MVMAILSSLILFLMQLAICRASTVCQPEEDIWRHIPCDEVYVPDDCHSKSIPMTTTEEYERCGPAALPLFVRNYYLAAAGRGFTKQANRDAFNRINIPPKLLRNIVKSDLQITTLNQTVAIPIGISSSAFHGLAHPDGELATAAAAVHAKTVMILSSFSSTLLEDVANVDKESEARFWMQIYVFPDRNQTVDIVRRAEHNGFEAIVLSVDANAVPKLTCNAKDHPDLAKLPVPNIPGRTFGTRQPPSLITFDDIKWVKSITHLPIVAKGILTGEDARLAVEHGASAILVSNHGGRQMDYAPATIDALPEVVDAVKDMHPRPDVYLDGGVINGYDVYKAIVRGAKMVFIGRLVIWGLALGGAEGVTDVLNILTSKYNETMVLAGAQTPADVWKNEMASKPPKQS